MAPGEVYEFRSYTLDVGERRLLNAGQVVRLPPKAHDVLVALVRRASYDLVIVRLGRTRYPHAWDQAVFVRDVLASVDRAPQ